MKNLKSLYLYFSSLMFVIAVIFSSSAFVDAGCFTCYSNNQNCPIAATCGMDQCDGTTDGSCDLDGEMCGPECDVPGES
ncbi:MAG: hypothetical protein ABJR05_15475 [Balneola sp.]